MIENNPPRTTRANKRGSKTVHSDAKMHCVCLLMIILNHTYRDMQNLAPYLRLPWDEPVPDHSTIGKYLQGISGEWLEKMVAQTARLYIEESGWTRGMLAADSTGVETTRYEKHIKPDKNRREFAEKRVKRYLKWHVTSILEPKIILCARITSGRRADSPVLRTMLNKIK